MPAQRLTDLAAHLVICFGDSLVKLGIVPAVIEGRLGRRAYNLSACAGQAPAT